MANAIYRGLALQTTQDSKDTWQVQIKSHMLIGSLIAVKKSIDWWRDTAVIIDPSEFESINSKRAAEISHEDNFNGYILKNDSGEINDWYCFFNGRLVKGSKLAIQKHIDTHSTNKQRALIAPQKSSK